MYLFLSVFSATISFLCPFKNSLERHSMFCARRNSYWHFCIHVSNSFHSFIKFCNLIIQYTLLPIEREKVKQMRTCGLVTDTKFHSQVFTQIFIRNSTHLKRKELLLPISHRTVRFSSCQKNLPISHMLNTDISNKPVHTAETKSSVTSHNTDFNFRCEHYNLELHICYCT